MAQESGGLPSQDRRGLVVVALVKRESAAHPLVTPLNQHRIMRRQSFGFSGHFLGKHMSGICWASNVHLGGERA